MDQRGRQVAELDYLYNAADRLYSRFARDCGISRCAYWMLYDLELAGGVCPLRELGQSSSYSKQTMNSALKVLESRELIRLDFEAGSRKHKVAALTDRGRAFSDANIVPAMEAEERAFRHLNPGERRTLIMLVRKYTDALNMEFGAMTEEGGAA